MYTIVKFLTLFSVQGVKSMTMPSYFMDNSGPENEITDFIYSKGYLPNENELPKATVIKNIDNDANYLLSKLSDDELIKLLNNQPKKNSYDLNDIVKIIQVEKYNKDRKLSSRDEIEVLSNLNTANKRFRVIPGVANTQPAYYKLNHKPIESKEQKNEINFMALKKLQDLLNYRPHRDDEDMTEDKRELLFDILVSQLKTLCCTRTKQSSADNLNINHVANRIITNIAKEKPDIADTRTPKLLKNNEFMFLIVNDEIRSKSNDDLILVDPEILEKNSSVLLLGPITTPLSDNQLKVVMDRISNELSKPEYAPLLQQLSDGTLNDNNVGLMKNFIFGHGTRRYIKPHRCNYQSVLSKIYGGPRWLICTGYLNLNTPSSYD